MIVTGPSFTSSTSIFANTGSGSAKAKSNLRQCGNVGNLWRDAGGDALSGQDWGSRTEREKWEIKVKPALSTLREQTNIREVEVDGARQHGVWEPALTKMLPALKTELLTDPWVLCTAW